MIVRVEPITTYTEGARRVALALRREDVDELWKISRSRPEEAVEQSIIGSTEAYTAWIGDTPVAVMGASISTLGRYGVPWLLGTRGIDDHAAEYIRMARKFLAHLHESCDVLENVALASNRRTLVFLSRMGFDIGKPIKVRARVEAVIFRSVKHV